MRNSKISFLILLTILILAAFAALPVIAASVQDNTTVNSSGYHEMESMKLDLNEEKETLPMMGKLALLGHMEWVNIDSSQASMTENEVFQAVETQMKAYEEAGIFQWFDVTLRSATPKLGIDLNDPNNFLVYWTVSFINEKDQSCSLLLDIDDETGKILCIRYDVYDSYSMDGVWERNKTIMDAFTDIYFAQLGMTEAKEYAESEAGYEYYERDGGVSNALYSFGDATYGEINIDFYVEGAGGFFIYQIDAPMMHQMHK